MKKRDLLSRLVTHQPGQKSALATWALAAPFVPVARPGTKGHPLLSRTGVPSWETGTTAISQSGQINIFVVVRQLVGVQQSTPTDSLPLLIFCIVAIKTRFGSVRCHIRIHVYTVKFTAEVHQAWNHSPHKIRDITNCIQITKTAY